MTVATDAAKRNANPTVRTFAPELWGEVEAFIHLSGSSYSFDERQRRTLNGTQRHFEKAVGFRDQVAAGLQPIQAEQQEMDRLGYSPALKGREAAQAFEAAVNELYSVLDNPAKTVRAIYGNGTRGFRDSTSWFFDNAEKISGALPAELKAAFSAAGGKSRCAICEPSLRIMAPGYVT